MIISGGENVYPREIELCLDEVDDIVEAAVVGVPHPDFGEAVVAFIVASPAFDADKAAVQLAGRLARFKQPKRYVVLDALPRNAMGKVQKATIRNDHLALFAE
jgi:malonyl-CoA/methylmalonyl-CoA synthetase